ncbi:MAG TPA: glutamate-1-semialdehyde 2,1-aminomutase [Limnochordia bacterium]|nr:glutamate-1-semialdehyde 2,1-aminomutase [Limnochordia bacterium]
MANEPIGSRNPDRSAEAFERARRVIPGGVNSPVRAFKAVGGAPRFIQRGAGARVTDLDGNVYLDYVCSWGALIAGHAHPEIVRAVQSAAERGTSFGAPTEAETRLAEAICAALPAIEQVRLVNSGTEATMSALRLARAATGRELIVKFAGCYHGHVDSLLIEAGSGALSLGVPSSPGVPAAFAQATLLARYNDLDSVAECFERHGSQIAAVIVEPVAGNMGVVPPQPGFLPGLRALTKQHGALLIFDEVITGFRVGPGGAQERYGVTPDLTCLGKVIGGGLPVGAYGGPAAIMARLAPEGDVYQAGTLSGNPLAMAAGLAALGLLGEHGTYATLERRAARLAEGIQAAAKRAGHAVQIGRVGSMLTPFFTSDPVTDQASALAADRQRYGRFFHALLAEGVYFPPAQFEALFVSTAHKDEEIEMSIAAVERAFRRLG